jgi:prevent-host-death family protein
LYNTLDMRVLAIGEARRRLPELVRRVAEGEAPVAIGRRGRPEVVLALPTAVDPETKKVPLRGLLRIVGSWEDMERAQHDIRRDLDAGLDRTARLLVARARKRRTRR